MVGTGLCFKVNLNREKEEIKPLKCFLFTLLATSCSCLCSMYLFTLVSVVVVIVRGTWKPVLTILLQGGEDQSVSDASLITLVTLEKPEKMGTSLHYAAISSVQKFLMFDVKMLCPILV